MRTETEYSDWLIATYGADITRTAHLQALEMSEAAWQACQALNDNIIAAKDAEIDRLREALIELKEKNKEYAKTQIGNVNPYFNNIIIATQALEQKDDK